MATKRAYHHGELRRALLDEARRVIAQDGIEAVKTNHLAAALGVSSAAPFRHFASRDALLVALAEEGAAHLIETMNAAAAGHEDPLEAHRARGVAYVRFAVEQPAYFRLLSRRDIVGQSTQIQDLAAQNLALMEQVLGAAQKGAASPAVARRSAGVLAAQALTYGLARMITDGLLGEITPSQAETLAHELTEVLGPGLAGD